MSVVEIYSHSLPQDSFGRKDIEEHLTDSKLQNVAVDFVRDKCRPEPNYRCNHAAVRLFVAGAAHWQ